MIVQATSRCAFLLEVSNMVLPSMVIESWFLSDGWSSGTYQSIRFPAYEHYCSRRMLLVLRCRLGIDERKAGIDKLELPAQTNQPSYPGRP
jgi:hypothetical protein